MNKKNILIILVGILLISAEGFGQDDRTFWQKLFGKKSETIDVEEPKNSQDSLATLLNNHLGNTTDPELEPEHTASDSSVVPVKPITSKGSFEVLADEKIKIWLDTAKSNAISGFRIQVHLGDLTECRGIRAALLNDGERATLDYNSSEYSVRVGDYRSFMEAEKRLASLKKTYPSAFVVRDKIKL